MMNFRNMALYSVARQGINNTRYLTWLYMLSLMGSNSLFQIKAFVPPIMAMAITNYSFYLLQDIIIENPPGFLLKYPQS